MEKIIIAGIVVLIVALIAWQIVGSVRRKKLGLSLLAAHPESARIYSRLGMSASDAFKVAVGAMANLQITAVDNAQCGSILDASGGFTPVSPGTHMLKLMATVDYPGVAKRIITGELSLTLAPYQCVFVGYDKQQNTFSVQDLGYITQPGASA